mmetsp:Transcript_52841/g.63689  ORF Transcript_52841/g.63689 Transcript_52841/m.63689 type:complete len:225 (+) Transcript_52841:1014-1688(+)
MVRSVRPTLDCCLDVASFFSLVSKPSLRTLVSSLVSVIILSPFLVSPLLSLKLSCKYALSFMSSDAAASSSTVIISFIVSPLLKLPSLLALSIPPSLMLAMNSWNHSASSSMATRYASSTLSSFFSGIFCSSENDAATESASGNEISSLSDGIGDSVVSTSVEEDSVIDSFLPVAILAGTISCISIPSSFDSLSSSLVGEEVTAPVASLPFFKALFRIKRKRLL